MAPRLNAVVLAVWASLCGSTGNRTMVENYKTPNAFPPSAHRIDNALRASIVPASWPVDAFGLVGTLQRTPFPSVHHPGLGFRQGVSHIVWGRFRLRHGPWRAALWRVAKELVVDFSFVSGAFRAGGVGRLRGTSPCGVYFTHNIDLVRWRGRRMLAFA